MIDSSHDFILDVKIDSQVIQAVTFFDPRSLEVTFHHFKGSLNHPKEVTKNCQVDWRFQIFFMFTPNLGEMIQFDFRIFFKMGWFNHQPAGRCLCKLPATAQFG